MKIVTIIPLEKGAFKEDLTYFTTKNVCNGDIVKVSIRNKKILGLVISVKDLLESKSGVKDMSFKLKKIIEVKEHSIFRNEFIESTFLLSSYFASKKNTGVVSLIPSLFREKYDELEKFSQKNYEETKSEIKTEKLIFQANFEDRISYYKTLIRGQFALKKSVFIVLPTEYDIELFFQYLSKCIENFTFQMHSNMKSKKIIENYGQIMSSAHSVLILGTPQFLSIPRRDLGTIIIEHESSNAYRTIQKPHFDLRTFTEIYASKINAKLVLADTLLRYETIGRKDTDSLGEVYPMSYRTNLNRVKINILNPNEDKDKKYFKIFDEESIREIEDTLKKNKKVFIFSLRKGLATYTICKDCNEMINCDDCLAPLTLYLSRDGKKRMFVCNKCNIEKDPAIKCANCGSWNLIPLGIGTDTVYEELKKILPKIKIFKLDKESTKTAKEAEKIIKEFEKEKSAILIGTEMAFYYLKEKIDLSIIASFDSLWSIPNYKMGEKIIQLLLSILSKTERKLIIQTKNKNDSALLAVKGENLLPYVREELEDRRNLNYPPYKRFIKITFMGDKEDSIKAKNLISLLFKEYAPDIFSGFIAKNKNLFITNALIKLEPLKWSLPELSHNSSIDMHLYNLLSSLPPSYKISVDPEDLL